MIRSNLKEIFSNFQCRDMSCFYWESHPSKKFEFCLAVFDVTRRVRQGGALLLAIPHLNFSCAYLINAAKKFRVNDDSSSVGLREVFFIRYHLLHTSETFLLLPIHLMKFLPKKFPMNEQYEKLPLFADGVIWLEMWNVRSIRYPLFMAKKISPAFNINSCIFKVQNKKNSIELENCPPLSFIASILYSKGLLAIFLMNSWMQQPIYQYEYFLHRLTESCNVAQIQSKHQTLTVMSFYVSRASKWVWQFSIRVKNVLQLENETLCLSLNSPFLFLFAISISLQKLLASFYDKCDKVIWLLPWKAMAFSAILKIIA